MTRLRLALAVLCAGTVWGAAPTYSEKGILTVGSYAPGPFAPNSLISVYGDYLANDARSLQASDIRNNTLPTNLDVSEVRIDGQPVALFYVSKKQINLLIPGKQALGKATLQVVREGQQGPAVTIEIGSASPDLFVLDGGYAIATHGDNKTITAENPARPGEVVVLYATGLGKCETMPRNGELVPYLSEVVNRATAFRVTIGGAEVKDIKYAGLTPGSAGLYQVNFVIPADAPADPEVRVYVGDAASPAGVKLLVRAAQPQPSESAGR